MSRNYIELLIEFVKTDFKLRYKNSYLGILWIVLKPLALFSVIFLIWSNIMKMGPDFKMGLLLGIIIMNFFHEGVMMGLTSLSGKAGIILKIKFPREIVVYSTSIISLFDFVLNMFVFGIFCIFTPISTSFVGILLFIFSVACVFVLILGVSQFLSIIFIKFRDLHNLMEVLLQLVFWMTPIYYTLEMMPESLANIIKLNPLTLIVTYARKGLLNGNEIRIEDFLQIGLLFLILLIILFLGKIFFKRKVIKIAEYF